MKCGHLNKKLIMCSVFLCSGIVGGRIAETVFQISQSNFAPAADKIIPPEWLDIDPDGVTLNGFRPSVTVDDLAIGGYDTLLIPFYITTIKDYAFAYMFDGKSCDVSKIILNTNIERIGNAAFINDFGIVNIDWSSASNLKVIGNQAFHGCDKLSRVPQFFNTLTTLGDNAFYGCTHMLGTLTFPSSLANVGTRTFYNCNKIVTIDFSNYSYIPAWIYRFRLSFANVGSEPGSLQPTVYVPLLNNSLDEWTNLLQKRHTLGDSFVIQEKSVLPYDDLNIDAYGTVKGIKDGVQISDYNYLSFPGKAVKIDDNAFKEKITSPITVEISDQIQNIGKNAFQKCTGIVRLQIPPDEQTGNPSLLKGIADEAFSGCTNLYGDLVLPKSLEGIGKKAFFECKNIRSISIPNSVKEVGKNAFAKCSNLSIIDIHTFTEKPEWEVPEPDKDYKEEDKIFKWIAPFGIILINNGFERIRNHDTEIDPSCPWNWFSAWYGLKDELQARAEIDDGNHWNIKRVHDENNITTEDMFDFYDITTFGFSQDLVIPDDLLKTDFIQLPSRVTQIANNAFANTFATEVKYEDKNDQDYYWYLKPMPGLQSIGDNAFLNDEYLGGSLSFSPTLEYIGKSAFYNCKRLRGNLILPNSVKHVGSAAFANCIMLSGDLNLGNLDEIESNIIWGTNFKQISINAMPHHINDSAFMGDISLEAIYINDVAPAPDQSYVFEDDAFLLPSTTPGTIYLSSTSTLDLDAWTTYLHNHGLPSEWNVQKS